MTVRDTINAEILTQAIADCEQATGATARDVLSVILTRYDFSPALLEWHSAPDGIPRCLSCGNTQGQRHAVGCLWND